MQTICQALSAARLITCHSNLNFTAIRSEQRQQKLEHSLGSGQVLRQDDLIVDATALCGSGNSSSVWHATFRGTLVAEQTIFIIDGNMAQCLMLCISCIAFADKLLLLLLLTPGGQCVVKKMSLNSCYALTRSKSVDISLSHVPLTQLAHSNR